MYLSTLSLQRTLQWSLPPGWRFGTLMGGPYQSVIASPEGLIGSYLNEKIDFNIPRKQVISYPFKILYWEHFIPQVLGIL